MKKLVLAAAVAAAASQASAITLNLVSVESQNWEKWNLDGGGASTAGHSAAQLTGGTDYIGAPGDFSSPVPYSGSTATWDYSAGTSTLTGSGNYFAHWMIHPWSRLYEQSADDLVLTAGGAASASAYECIDGNFGSSVGGNLCGNWEYGTNYFNESSISYTGTTWARTMGGDDVISGAPQQISDYDNDASDDDLTYAGDVNVNGQTGASGWSWDGTTLIINNASGNTTQTLTFVSAVPVPAAAWLFGSALVGLAGVGRKRKMA